MHNHSTPFTATGTCRVGVRWRRWRRRPRWQWQRGGGRRRRRQRQWRRRRGRRWRHWRWRRRLRRRGREDWRGATRAHEGRPLVRRPATRGMGRLKQHRAAERDAHRHPAHRHSSDASRPGRRLQQSRCMASGASAKRTRRFASAFIQVDPGETRTTEVSPAATEHDARTSAGSGRGDRA